MKKVLSLLSIVACCGLCGAADTVMHYVNVNDVATSEMNNGIPASTGMTATWNNWGFPAVMWPSSIGIPARTSNSNEKVMRFRDSLKWNRLYVTAAPNNSAWNLANQRLTFWGYTKWEPVLYDETLFGVILRAPWNKVPDTSWVHSGYFCWFAARYSYWNVTDADTGVKSIYYPQDYSPFIMRANRSGVWNKMLAENRGYKVPVEDGWHFYSAEAVGDTIRLCVDNAVVLEATDSSAAKYSGGFPMIVVYWNDQTYKDPAGNWTTLGLEEITISKTDALSNVHDWSVF